MTPEEKVTIVQELLAKIELIGVGEGAVCLGEIDMGPEEILEILCLLAADCGTKH